MTGIQLNTDQSEIVKFAAQGHNLLITGQAGVGKSEVVKAIIKSVNARGQKLGVVCSSGIACQVYDRGVASTVHSFYGLSTAEFPWRQVIDRSVENSLIRDRVMHLDVIIWDEASMSSQRMFELVNFLHHELAEDELCRSLPFAGKQIILVGEFLQLQPVPNLFDDGSFMFYSSLFDFAISHRFGLTKVMRQSEHDRQFLSALADIRVGKCLPATEEYLTSLERELPLTLQQTATHIFFRKVPVQLLNRRKLDGIDGDVLTFEATFDNDSSRCMSWPGAPLLKLKLGCKVMLVWNKSDDLKNGTLGILTGMRGVDCLLVAFEGVGIVEIGRETWIKRDRNGRKVGSVTQFPIVLAYAVTCHKSQGLTLPSAVVHCSTEYVPGLIYVAISRVKSPEHIQILNFNHRQLLKPEKKAVEICSSNHVCAPVADLSCCRRKCFDHDQLLCVKDRFHECEEDEEPFSFPGDMLDGPVRACFDDPDVDVPLELLEVYDQLTRHESILSSPPEECFNKCRDHLLSLKAVSVVSLFLEEKNRAIDFMTTEACWVTKVHAFVKLIWFHAFLIVEDHIVENNDEFVIDIGRQGFTEATSSLHQFFSSADFSKYVCVVFGVNESTPPQRAVAIKLATFIYWEFLERLISVVRQREGMGEPIAFDVGQMGAVGRSKVRHVGGWSVRKVLTRARKYVQRNVYTDSSSTLATVEKQQRVCELLEENIIQPYHQLEESSRFPETLQVTEVRQYRQRGLLHISDDAYLFFMQLEQRRVDLLNHHVLKRAREDMVEAAMSSLSSDESLKASWQSCFQDDDAEKSKELIEKMLHGILVHYVNMGASQFLRDFRRSSLIKKSVELRKRILQRKEKTKEKTDSVPFKEILKDRSQNKTVSHSRLVSFIHQHPGTAPLSRVFLKAELLALCQAYGVRKSTRSSKLVIAQALLSAISDHTCIPITDPVDDRQFRVTENSESNGHIRIRLSRGIC